MERLELNVQTGQQAVLAMSHEEIAAVHAAALADAPDYARLRRQAYPPVGDQLDALMRWVLAQDTALVNGPLRSIAADCAAVKRLYPKPGEA